MRWNPFRRATARDRSDSAFEATVAGDLAAATQLGEDPASALDEATVRRMAQIGANTLPVKRPMIGHVGRYALKAVLGEGGLGTVYAAWDPLLSRAVAVKTLRLRDRDDDADTQTASLPSDTPRDDLILNEARAAARLSHPHIVTVFDAGPSDQGIYIAMEPLRGRDLRHMLQEGWRPNPVEAAQIVRKVADALAYAHGKGVIHCDIKPANIFMVGRRNPKVLDFGIARIAHRDAPSVQGPLAGSPYYLAPEQLRGDSLDRRCDVYSLGVVLFELLTGQRPYTGAGLPEIMRAVAEAPQPQARQVSPRLPAALSAITARAMARAPADRYPSARHLSLALRDWLEQPEARALAEGPKGRLRRQLTLAGLVLGSAGLAALAQSLWLGSSAVPAAPADTVVANGPSAGGVDPPATADSAAPGGAQAGAPDPQSPGPSPQPTPAAAEAAPAERPAPRERRPRPQTAQTAAKPPVATPATVPTASGELLLAISPWGQVEIDGSVLGVSPPLNRLSLPAGTHTITIRNGELPPVVRSVEILADHPVTLKHRFEQ